MNQNVADITVIIPYYNEEKTILTTLRLVTSQTLMPKEVFLVNSSSSDGTSKIINKWINKNQQSFSTKFRNLFEGTTNPACSKNLGICRAQTEWVAFMDCRLIFPVNWLELQFKFVLTNKLSVVSGVVYLEGENSIDRAAVAQTYGYQKKRACVPSSLVKKEVFAQTGLFLKKRRAGYDVAWVLLLRKLNIKRGINKEMVVVYNGINFGKNLKQVYKKSVLYALPTLGTRLYLIPYYYLGLLLFSILLCLIYPPTIGLFFIGYIFIRGAVLPTIKGNYIQLLKDDFSQVYWLLLVGLVMDFGRSLGVTLGFVKYHLGLDLYNEKS